MISFDRKSWVKGAENTEFPLQNLPFGVYSTSSKSKRVGAAIGNKIVDLQNIADKGIIDIDASIFDSEYINDFMELGKAVTVPFREKLAEILDEKNTDVSSRNDVSEWLDDMSDATMHLPIKVGDYTDFYSSRDHATNVGKMFRDPANALLPNWLHIPVGYHGRASSIVVSGTEFHRPKGQVLPPDSDTPTYNACRLMDFELEMAFVIGKSTNLGDTISTENAEDHIFGITLFNDLSARDIQKWEYVPLGPFLGKNFCSVVSPWIVTLEAFDSFRVAGEEQNPKVQPYLEFSGNKNYNINLEVSIKPEGGEENLICESNFKYMYWNMCQQLAHHTVNGCNVNVGDMMASGTISGPDPRQFGSMLELSWKGTKPIKMNDGTERKFMQDNDTCIMRGYAQKDGVKIGFGDCTSKVLPAK